MAQQERVTVDRSESPARKIERFRLRQPAERQAARAEAVR